MKQIYHIMALLAILHLLVLIVSGAFLAATGRVDAEKIEKIAAVLRGEAPGPEGEPVSSRPAAAPILAKASSEKIAEAQTTDEVRRLMGERLLREAADRKALVDAVMLNVTRQREALAKERSDFEAAQKQARRADLQSGMKAELEILSKLSEKKARDLLMKKQTPDAVNLLMRMKTRTAAGIIEACKTETEKAWAIQVLQEIANQDEGQARKLDEAVR